MTTWKVEVRMFSGLHGLCMMRVRGIRVRTDPDAPSGSSPHSCPVQNPLLSVHGEAPLWSRQFDENGVMSCWAGRLRRSACPKLPVCANVCRIVQLVSSPNRWQWQGSADSKSGAARFSRGGAPSLGPGTWAWLRARSSQSAMLLPWARKVPSAGRFGGVKRHGTARGCDPSSLFCQLRLKRTRRLLPTFRASLPRVEATTRVARPDFAFPWPCLAAVATGSSDAHKAGHIAEADLCTGDVQEQQFGCNRMVRPPLVQAV